VSHSHDDAGGKLIGQFANRWFRQARRPFG
jgi:hypothetical protein